MIEPTPGRIVWFFPSIEQGRDPNGQPLAAIVAKVLSERYLNLTVCHGDGTTYAAQSIQLLQDDDTAPEGAAHATWMPFQKGQAARHEQVKAAEQPADLQPVHEKIDLLASGVQTKFEELGAWLMTTFKDIEERFNRPATPPSPPLAPGAADAASHAGPTAAEVQQDGGGAPPAIGASDAPGANLTAEGAAAAASPNSV
jgi:hypothetical protein